MKLTKKHLVIILVLILLLSIFVRTQVFAYHEFNLLGDEFGTEIIVAEDERFEGVDPFSDIKLAFEIYQYDETVKGYVSYSSISQSFPEFFLAPKISRSFICEDSLKSYNVFDEAAYAMIPKYIVNYNTEDEIIYYYTRDLEKLEGVTVEWDEEYKMVFVRKVPVLQK